MSILASMSNPVDGAIMAAACFPHSGDWLTALPNISCGLCIDNEGVRVAVSLWLGLDLCSPHKCQCGDAVSSDGHHGLVCRLSKGRSTRHHAINDIIWRSLQSADVPSMKEPSGLLRTDGKRPDDSFPAGRYMAWDATVVHTCAASYLSHHTCRRQQSRQVLQLSRLQDARRPNMHCCLQPMCLSPLPSKLLGL